MSPRIARIGPALRGTALVAAALAAAAGSTGAALASPSLAASSAHKVNAPAVSRVPSASVGLGWSVAEYSTASEPNTKPVIKGKTTLYLVSPQGKKTAFYNVPAGTGLNMWRLIDWSGDGQRVLLGTPNGAYEQVSVKTGKVVNKFSLTTQTSITVIGYTRPHGENILATAPGGIGVDRYDLQGRLQQRLSKTALQVMESPDGTSVVAGTQTGLQLISNTGGVLKNLPPAAGQAFCQPERWWNAKTILAECNAKHGSGAPRLWLFPAGGGKVTPLTPQRSGKSGDLGDISAWKISSGTYTQALGPCGVEFIAKVSGAQVKVPGSNLSSDKIVTGLGSQLLVSPLDGCGGQASLAWFNPGTKHVTWILKPGKNLIGAEIVVPFGRPLS